MNKSRLCAVAFLIASATSCAHRKVIPDRSGPHQVAKEAKVVVWCALPDGKLEQCDLRLLEGDWVAPRELVEQ